MGPHFWPFVYSVVSGSFGGCWRVFLIFLVVLGIFVLVLLVGFCAFLVVLGICFGAFGLFLRFFGGSWNLFFSLFPCVFLLTAAFPLGGGLNHPK